MRLQELQNTIQQYLMAIEGDVTIAAEITPVANGKIAERLNIYHHAYRSRIREALSSQFPNLAKLLGAEVFNQYMDAFIARYPSTHRNMRWLGDQLSNFLQVYAPNKKLYADMANFEWRLGLAFDSLDTPCLTIWIYQLLHQSNGGIYSLNGIHQFIWVKRKPMLSVHG